MCLTKIVIEKQIWIGVHLIYVCVYVCFCAILFAVCFAGYNEKRLLHDLLDTYNTLERPVVNESDPLQISFGLTLMQIIDVDEKNQMLVTNIWLKLVSNGLKRCSLFPPSATQIILQLLTLAPKINLLLSHKKKKWCWCNVVPFVPLQEWNDMNLRWNTSDYGGVKDLRM